jgi:ACS family D-galactonate transporter-like MFS transporter
MSDSSSPLSSRQAWLTVALLWPVALLNYLDRQVLSTLQPAIGMDIAAVLDSQNFGRLMGIFLWIYGLMSPVSGLVADRFSRKRLIVGSLCVWSVVTLLMGYANDFQQLYWMRALMGVSEALYIPAALALITDFHQGRTRSLAVGIHMTGLYCGQALGGFGALAAEQLSWRTTFQGLGITGILYGLILAIFLKERKAPSGTTESFVTVLGGMRRSLGALFSIGAFFVILFYFAAPSAPGWVVKNWLPTLFAKIDPNTVRAVLPTVADFTDAEIASKVAKPLSTIVIAISGFVGVIFGGIFADRWAQRNLRGRIYTGAIGLSLTIPALLALGYSQSPAMALGAAVLYGFGFGLFDANNMPVLCQFVPPRLRAAAYGFMNLIGVSAGALSTEVIGKLDQSGKLAQGIGWLALPVLIAVALVLVLRPTTLNRTDLSDS